MAAIDVLEKLRPNAAALAFLVTTVAAPCTAQPFDPVAPDETQRLLVAQIEEIQSLHGPNSPDLIDPLTRLGLFYEESGDEPLAIAAVERALQVVRVNDGLRSLEQAPLIRQLIRNEESRGNHSVAWDLEQELLKLLRRHPDDVTTVPFLREIADKQIEVLGRYLGGELPPQLILGCYYKPFPNSDRGNCNAGSRSEAVRGMLAEAQRNYAEAILVLLGNALYASDELHELEMEIVRSSDLPRSRDLFEHTSVQNGRFPLSVPPEHLEPWRSRVEPFLELARSTLPYMSAGPLEKRELRGHEDDLERVVDPYHRARQSLARLYAYEVATASPLLDQIDALIRMADWDLLYSNNGLALERYDRARVMLEDAHAAAAIEQRFFPQTPVVLPTFDPNPFAHHDTRPSAVHIDVAFEITQFGRGRRIEILDAANATETQKADLIELIKNTRFRPRVTNGLFGASSSVVVRFDSSE